MSESMVLLPGERCKKAREEQGMSLADVANSLHLSLSYLQALEADDYDRLPEAAFVKGYLKNYARLLGLPADDLANMFQQILNEDNSSAEHDKQETPRKRGVSLVPWVLVVLAVGALAAWQLRSPADNDDEPAADYSAPATEADETPIQPDAVPADSEDNDATVLALSPDAENTDTAEDENLAAPYENAQSAESALAEVEPVDAEKQLRMTFAANCWVQVSDATGETLRQGEQRAGSTLTLSGVAPLQLRIGDAGAVSAITLDGEAVALPSSTPGRVVRITLP